MTVNKSKLKNSPFETVVTNAVNLRQTFNNTQNYTVPNTVSGIWIHLAGGGQGGSSRNTGGQTANGAGGTGGNGVFAYTPVTAGSTIGITIGAGGAGGTLTANTSSVQVGLAGGITYVNTSGASFVAGGGLGNGTPDAANTFNQNGYQGKLYGLSRQQIVFSDKTNSGRISQLFAIKEGVGYGGAQQGWGYNESSLASARQGQNSVYGGASGGGAVTNSAGGGNGQDGGVQNLTGRTGGTGVTYAATNGGAGGGGAGIAGNGAAGSGTTGGAGGAGGGGGGGGGANSANSGCTGGAGGAGAVLIYY